MELFEMLRNVANCKVGELLEKLKEINSSISTVSITDEETDKTTAAFVILRGDNVDEILKLLINLKLIRCKMNNIYKVIQVTAHRRNDDGEFTDWNIIERQLICTLTIENEFMTYDKLLSRNMLDKNISYLLIRDTLYRAEDKCPVYVFEKADEYYEI